MSSQTIGGRYELEQPLGGGMGSVWLAHDRKLERDVAVKLLAKDADRARFEREAHAVAGLSHPNTCRLYDYGHSSIQIAQAPVQAATAAATATAPALSSTTAETTTTPVDPTTTGP